MDEEQQFEAMVEACLKAHESVVEAGTPAMIAMTRSLLWQIAQETIQREDDRKKMLRYREVKERSSAL